MKRQNADLVPSRSRAPLNDVRYWKRGGSGGSGKKTGACFTGGGADAQLESKMRISARIDNTNTRFIKTSLLHERYDWPEHPWLIKGRRSFISGM
jgi:hypothetical protein